MAGSDLDPAALLDVLPILVWRSGRDALCDYFNQAWLKFTGRRLEQELGNGWAEGVHPGDRERCVREYLDAFSARKPFTLEYRLKHRDGGYRWIHDIGQPLFASDGGFLGYLGGCIDITARKTLTAALDGALDERERLLRDLHDSIVQKMFAISIGLESARLSLEEDPAAASERLALAAANLNDVTQEIRGHVSRLAERGIDRLPLDIEIEALVRSVGAASRRPRFHVKVDSRAAATLSQTASRHVLNIVREAISNSLRHSHATRGLVSLSPYRGGLRVTIEDNGRGFDARQGQSRGRGLSNIAARAHELSARLDVRSNRRAGTRITVHIPPGSQPA